MPDGRISRFLAKWRTLMQVVNMMGISSFHCSFTVVHPVSPLVIFVACIWVLSTLKVDVYGAKWWLLIYVVSTTCFLPDLPYFLPSHEICAECRSVVLFLSKVDIATVCSYICINHKVINSVLYRVKNGTHNPMFRFTPNSCLYQQSSGIHPLHKSHWYFCKSWSFKSFFW